MWMYEQDLAASKSYLQNNFGKTVRVHSLGGKLARHNDRCGTVIDRMKGGIVVRFHDSKLPRVVEFPLENLILTGLTAPGVSPPPRPKHARGLAPHIENIPKASPLPKNLSPREHTTTTTVSTVTTTRISRERSVLHEKQAQLPCIAAAEAVGLDTSSALSPPRNTKNKCQPIKEVCVVLFRPILRAYCNFLSFQFYAFTDCRQYCGRAPI